MPAQDNMRVVTDFFEAINRHDVDSVLSFCDSNVEWYDVPTGNTYRGHNGVRQLMQRWWSAFSDNSVQIMSTVAGDANFACEYIARGTHDGPIDLPSGSISPTNRRVELPFCDVYQIRNGKIVSCHVYYDFYSLMRQLGMTRQAGA